MAIEETQKIEKELERKDLTYREVCELTKKLRLFQHKKGERKHANLQSRDATK